MFEKIIEIIVFLISELKQNKSMEDIDVSELRKLGYTKSEISTAFSWLVDRVEFSEEILKSDENKSMEMSFRVLHEAEWDLFTVDAWGEMVQLHSLGILNNENMESIIERAVMGGSQKIDTKRLKEIVASILFNAETSSTYGNRMMLLGSDSIH